jgi:NitT/TauT family transport system substrate-binding protein
VVGGHRSLQRLLNKEADLATCSETVIMFNSASRPDLAVLSTFVSSNDDVKLIAHPDSGIHSAADLKGKRIGVTRGVAGHYYLDTLSLIHGVSSQQLILVDLAPDALPAALKNREVDAIAAWQPFAYQAGQDIPGARTLDDGGFHTLSFNLVMSRQQPYPDADQMRRLLRALDKANQFIAAQPAAAQAILQQRLGLDQRYAQWVFGTLNFGLRLDQSLISALESEARWARENGYLSTRGTINFLDLIEAQPLRGLPGNRVGIVK